MKKSEKAFLIIIVVIAILFTLFMIVGEYSESHYEDMPELEGLTVSEAKKEIKDDGFTEYKFINNKNNDCSKDKDAIVVKQSVKDGKFIRKDKKIVITCRNGKAYKKEQKQNKIKKELENKLPESVAIDAIKEQGKNQFPNGFKLHTSKGIIEHTVIDENTWFFKIKCTTENYYGEKRDTTCQAHVTGTEEAPIINDFYIY